MSRCPFFSVILLPRHSSRTVGGRFSPWVAFSVSMLHPKILFYTVDVFQWAVPCVQYASSKCVILHLNAVEPISFLERSVLLSPKLQDFFVKANEQSASQSLPSSWGSSKNKTSSVTLKPSSTQAASTTRRDTRAAAARHPTARDRTLFSSLRSTKRKPHHEGCCARLCEGQPLASQTHQCDEDGLPCRGSPGKDRGQALRSRPA